MTPREKYTPELENLEIALLLQAIQRLHGVDLQEFSTVPVRRRIWEAIKKEKVRTVSGLQERLLHDREALNRFLKAVLPPVFPFSAEFFRKFRFDLIPIPVRLRLNIDARTIMEFPVEVGLEMLALNPGELAARIAPRPLLLLHSAKDDVIAVDGSFELFRAAGAHGDLHIIGGVDHFMFSENDRRVTDIVRNWLARSFPVE